MISQAKNPWEINQALNTYQIPRWGAGYFSINKEGNICVRPVQDAGPELDLFKVIREALERKLNFPLLLRFQDLLRHRVLNLNQAFNEAIEEANYKGKYRAVFPIKVNQLREVIEEIVDAGSPFHHGLEAGSKAELFAALAMLKDSESLLICNGFKDRLFVDSIFLGRKLGKKVIQVLEKVEELDLVIDGLNRFKVDPIIGVRLQLASKGRGHWAYSSGEEAKFGLSTAELLQVIQRLKDNHLSSCLQLIHFHIGSQIPDIITIKRAVREASRYYARLYQLGFPIQYIDVGGGLGVDYDGSRSTDSSINYSLQEYARDVVYNIAEICNEEKVPHPTIVTESGRAVVAHHSVLVVDVLEAIQKIKPLTQHSVSCKSNHKLVQDLLELKTLLNKKNRLENYHDSLQIKEDAQSMFELGLLDLQTKAEIETLYWEICKEVVNLYNGAKQVPEEIRKLRESLSDQYLCNFSVFQSLIDHWGLGQIFPVVPISMLNEKPNNRGFLVDITCDSDGKICSFLTGEEKHQSSIPLHNLDSKPYLLGIFLVGAYQDIMGDLHNLFGRVNEAHVFIDPDEPDGFYIEETIPALTIGEALSAVQYEPKILENAMKNQIDNAIKQNLLKPNEGMRLLEFYENGLKRSTYLEIEYDQLYKKKSILEVGLEHSLSTGQLTD
ncbi:biosynthetic arginine decarboxylase [Methylacidiphilum caldifontis]|uniref:biosynthetic arginine decarboxylase n=1 Tax=Methylacidiphilum caldifontis TaxID=2795386 RepID=UPI001F5DEEAD|nr:biosynthetic arginine decarboxylase [Methylacidiphilum caldifontis]